MSDFPFQPGDKVWCLDAENLYGNGEFEDYRPDVYPNADLTHNQQYVIARIEHSGYPAFGPYMVRLAGKKWHYRSSRFSKEPYQILPTPDWSLEDLELAQMEIEEIERGQS